MCRAGLSVSVARLACWVVASIATNGIVTASDLQRLEFRWETQNIQFATNSFGMSREGIEVTCKDLSGELRFGALPHRLAHETMIDDSNFIDFVVAYTIDAPPAAFLDLDQDGQLECEERVDLLAHPKDSGKTYRTLKVHWKDTGASRERLYRVTVPAQLEAPGSDGYSLELVSVPVARWSEGTHDTIWILVDGNHNGMFDRKFGDGILVDTTGSGNFDVRPYGENFLSYHAPIVLPWGAFEILDVDPEGRFLILERFEGDVSAFEPLSVGDMVPPLECRAGEGGPVSFGGTSDLHQLVYFWVSSCGTCWLDVERLVPVLTKLGPERISSVGVSFDEDYRDYEKFVLDNHLEWPQCFSSRMFWDNTLARRFGAKSPSDFILIGPSGRLVASGNGIEQVEAALREHLGHHED